MRFYTSSGAPTVHFVICATTMQLWKWWPLNKARKATDRLLILRRKTKETQLTIYHFRFNLFEKKA